MAGPRDTPRPVDDALHDMDEDFLACRDLHHAWSVDHYGTGGGGVVERVLVCQRCGTERVDNWTLRGSRNTARYHYAEGYQLRGVDAPGDREAMRREVLRRAGITDKRPRRRR